MKKYQLVVYLDISRYSQSVQPNCRNSLTGSLEAMFGRKKTISPQQSTKNLGPKVYLPPADPLPEVKPTPRSALSEGEEQKYEVILKHFQDDALQLPVSEKEEEKKSPLTREEKLWLTRDCMLRYARACSWKVEEAIKRIESSIVWRREFGIAGGEFQTLFPDMVSVENETGKQVIFGFDHGARPCLFLKNGRQNTKPSFRQIQHLIFMLETVIRFMPPGEDNLALCVDFKSYPEVALKGSNMPSVGVGKQVLHILQYHYPERLGRALFINIPWYAWAFLKICYPFVDPYTKQKIAFDEPFTSFIPLDQLDQIYGGNLNFEYDHSKYWTEMISIADSKYSQYMEKFDTLGGVIGLNEFDLRSS